MKNVLMAIIASTILISPAFAQNQGGNNQGGNNNNQGGGYQAGFGGSLDAAVRPLQVFGLGIGQAGNLMPPFRASSIRRSRSDVFWDSVAVFGFTPAASYMR